jgi:hypothetical protein
MTKEKLIALLIRLPHQTEVQVSCAKTGALEPVCCIQYGPDPQRQPNGARFYRVHLRTHGDDH